MNAAELLDDLARRGFTLTPEGDDIRVSPSSRLDPELRRTIRGLKPALLALLRGKTAIHGNSATRSAGEVFCATEPADLGDLRPRRFPIGWEEELGLERALLRHRIAACTDPDVRARLEALATETPASEAEWLRLGRRILALEGELRQQGRLPSVDVN